MRPLRAAIEVCRKELVDALRDRRTLLVVLLSGVLLGPAVLIALSGLVAGLEEKCRAAPGADRRHRACADAGQFPAAPDLRGARHRRPTTNASCANRRWPCRCCGSAPISSRCCSTGCCRVSTRRRQRQSPGRRGAGTAAAAARRLRSGACRARPGAARRRAEPAAGDRRRSWSTSRRRRHAPSRSPACCRSSSSWRCCMAR